MCVCVIKEFFVMEIANLENVIILKSLNYLMKWPVENFKNDMMCMMAKTINSAQIGLFFGCSSITFLIKCWSIVDKFWRKMIALKGPQAMWINQAQIQKRYHFSNERDVFVWYSKLYKIGFNIMGGLY